MFTAFIIHLTLKRRRRRLKTAQLSKILHAKNANLKTNNNNKRTLIWLNHSLCAYICFRSALCNNSQRSPVVVIIGGHISVLNANFAPQRAGPTMPATKHPASHATRTPRDAVTLSSRQSRAIWPIT